MVHLEVEVEVERVGGGVELKRSGCHAPLILPTKVTPRLSRSQANFPGIGTTSVGQGSASANPNLRKCSFVRHSALFQHPCRSSS